jgi:hypothetical protein
MNAFDHGPVLVQIDQYKPLLYPYDPLLFMEMTCVRV